MPETNEGSFVTAATSRSFVEFIFAETIFYVDVRVRCHRLIDEVVRKLGVHLEHELPHDDVA